MPISKNKQQSAKATRNPSRKPLKAAVSRGAHAGTGAKDRQHQKPTGMVLCDRCGAVYFEGHWHTSPALSAILRKSEKTVGEKELCLQCRMAKSGQKANEGGFEGEVTLDNLGNLEEKAEILSTIRNVGNKATARDPMDRIINIDDRGARVVVTTTENQLAVALGKAVDAAHKGGKLTIVFSHKGDLPARVYWKHK
jgi:hypothetical protein